jgi:cell division transport system permease protein
MGKLSFFFQEAFGSLRRNYFMTIAALVTVFLSIVVLGVVLVFVFTTDSLLGDVEQKVQINVYFKRNPDPAPDQMTTIQNTIEGWTDQVSKVTFVSKEEALQIMKDKLKDNPNLIESLPRNPFPHKLVIALVDPTQVDTVAARIQTLDPDKAIIDEVKWEKDTAQKLFTLTAQVRNILVGFIVLLGVVSVLLISNTIRLSIFARKREVEIMKLVGATNWFIRWPFVIEGVTVGLVGAGAAAATVLLVNSYSVGKLRDLMPFMGIPMNAVPSTMVALVLVGAGVVIGALGSALGLRRLLKV